MTISPIINKSRFLSSLRKELNKKVAASQASESEAIQVDLRKKDSTHKLNCKVRTLIGGGVHLEVYRLAQEQYFPVSFTANTIGVILLDRASKNAVKNPSEKTAGTIDKFFKALDHIINISINDHKPDRTSALQHFKDFAKKIGKASGQKATYSKTENRHSYTIKLKAKDSGHILDLLPRELLYPFLNQWSAALRKKHPEVTIKPDGKSVTYSLFSRSRPLSTEGVLTFAIEKGHLVLSYSEFN